MSTTVEVQINSSEWTIVPLNGASSMVITNETGNNISYAFGASAPTIIGHTLDLRFDNIIEGIIEDIWIKCSSGRTGKVSVTRIGV